ncbi:MAG: 3-oxoacyl-[acyl-carrier protein] reductase [Mycobacteriales bacterium]|jgi:3-oxoacyl-[acyl-carrier protein] reductase
MDLGLAGRVYVVSGGSRGLGRATAAALVADGARVVIGARDAAAVERSAQELGGPAHAVGVEVDLSVAASAQRLVEAAHTAYGGLDGALISVGGPPTGTAMDTSEDDWRDAFDSVFLGALRLARRVAGAIGADGGAIGIVLSSSVRSPIPGLAISNGLRPGLAGLAKTLADELGPRGIRVFGLMPGRIATDRTVHLDSLGGDAAAARERNEAAIPLRRYGEPAEFGRVAAFLLSPAASYLTGLTVPVDGGAGRMI